jgi:site-specific DNA-cytosine methylase
MTSPKILIACEESQVVTTEFRNLGYEAWSCDILPTSGNRPDWHLQQDVIPLLKEVWDLIIAFPPCTHLANSGAKHFAAKQADGRQQLAIDFFLAFTQANSPRIAIENPIGIMSTKYKKPSQIVQPWMFGDNYNKSTCLWLKGLPKLVATQIKLVSGNKVFKSGKKMSEWYYATSCLPHKERAKARSKTPLGLATQMAIQWSKVL